MVIPESIRQKAVNSATGLLFRTKAFFLFKYITVKKYLTVFLKYYKKEIIIEFFLISVYTELSV